MAGKSFALMLAFALGGGFALAPAPGTAASAAGTAVECVPSAVIPIANWKHPYKNIDHRWDAGNDTGDAMVEQLNEQQLNKNYRRGYPPPGQPYPQPPR